ncbi:hypothetical protein [Facklamia sp. 7083-14-GEN3]|uniref:hypothetical protein n=1 Tax=Facklamia sp. 7083-14-GEN3 TaxID=2973478 RepID=UPI00215C7878|nr:hypothetical protein [Facklamia sp. 7083-14-GEN3]MCR8969384.1 hypothetical protein [Facklamia sp. 7083-14-GEN3]
MKVHSSFIKELKIASRGFYFYIELVMALIIVGLFLFAVPDNFNRQSTEYLYLDMSAQDKESYLQSLKDTQPEVEEESVKIKINDEEKEITQYTLQDKQINLIDNRQQAEFLADKEGEMVAIIQMTDKQEISYEYLLQGYESSRFRNLLKILHVKPLKELEEAVERQEVRSLSNGFKELSDKENLLPSVLLFNGALMGVFIIAAYVFLDRQEGVIKALALTPSPVWQYLSGENRSCHVNDHYLQLDGGFTNYAV